MTNLPKKKKGGAGLGQGRKKKASKPLHCLVSEDVADILDTHEGHTTKTNYLEASVRFYHESHKNSTES